MNDVTSSTDESFDLSTSDLSSFFSAPAPESVPADVRKKWRESVTRIRDNVVLYYTMQPVTSDAEYDEMFRQLQQLEEQWPDLVVSDSPTQQVSARVEAPANGEVFRPVEYLERFHSLDNVSDEQELYGWLACTLASTYLTELKIDSPSIDPVYKKDRLVRVAIRRDGRVGKNVTVNVRTIEDIPYEISGENVPDVLEVRGEVFILLEELERINSSRVDADQKSFASPRNVAAGSLRQKDVAEMVKRRLSMICHGIGHIEGWRSQSQHEAYRASGKWGFHVSPYTNQVYFADDVVKQIQYWGEHRYDAIHEMDGLVVKVDPLSEQRALGATLWAPR